MMEENTRLTPTLTVMSVAPQPQYEDYDNDVEEESCAELRKLAESTNLPEQIIECFIQSGFDTVSSVAELNNLQMIETFLRENFCLFENFPKRACIYGIYSSYPEKFSFLPGHIGRVNKFVDICKSITQKRRQSRFKLVLKPQLNSAASQAPSHPLVITVCEEKSSPSPPLGSSSRVSSAVTHSSSTEQHGDHDLVNFPTSSYSSEGSFQSRKSSPMELSTYAAIKAKLKNWTQTQEDKNLHNLQLEKHYKIVVNMMLQLNEIEQPHLQPIASVLCCICHTHVKLHQRKTTFTIANAICHFVSCVKNRNFPSLKV